jgi:hypothetical protein
LDAKAIKKKKIFSYTPKITASFLQIFTVKSIFVPEIKLAWALMK